MNHQTDFREHPTESAALSSAFIDHGTLEALSAEEQMPSSGVISQTTIAVRPNQHEDTFATRTTIKAVNRLKTWISRDVEEISRLPPSVPSSRTKS